MMPPLNAWQAFLTGGRDEKESLYGVRGETLKGGFLCQGTL